MRPVIGITPLMDTKLDSYWMLPDYMQAVQQAGGLPLMLPFQYNDESINQMVELCDGLVFTGGEDIDPSWYHAERLPVCGESIAVRTNWRSVCCVPHWLPKSRCCASAAACSSSMW